MKQKKVQKKHKSKELCENVRYVSNQKISRIYTTKKAIEMVNLKKGDKGMWTIYTDFAKSNKPGELDDEGMVLNLDRNTRTAKGHYFVTTFYRNGKLPDEKEL